MQVDKPFKLLAVRFPEVEMRRIKSLAALQGLSLQEAVHQALEAWAAKVQPGGASRLDPRPPDALPDSVGSGDVQKPRRQSNAAKRALDRRSGGDGRQARGGAPDRRGGAEAGRAAGRTGSRIANPEDASLAWLRYAMRLDWSKCPAVESVRGKTGNVWVFTGTRVPLAAVFKAFEQGHPVGKILEGYGLSREQLKAVMRFAAESLVLPPSAR